MTSPLLTLSLEQLKQAVQSGPREESGWFRINADVKETAAAKVPALASLRGQKQATQDDVNSQYQTNLRERDFRAFGPAGRGTIGDCGTPSPPSSYATHLGNPGGKTCDWRKAAETCHDKSPGNAARIVEVFCVLCVGHDTLGLSGDVPTATKTKANTYALCPPQQQVPELNSLAQ